MFRRAFLSVVVSTAVLALVPTHVGAATVPAPAGRIFLPNPVVTLPISRSPTGRTPITRPSSRPT
jgi:hypothetical protein